MVALGGLEDEEEATMVAKEVDGLRPECGLSGGVRVLACDCNSSVRKVTCRGISLGGEVVGWGYVEGEREWGVGQWAYPW